MTSVYKNGFIVSFYFLEDNYINKTTNGEKKNVFLTNKINNLYATSLTPLVMLILDGSKFTRQ